MPAAVLGCHSPQTLGRWVRERLWSKWIPAPSSHPPTFAPALRPSASRGNLECLPRALQSSGGQTKHMGVAQNQSARVTQALVFGCICQEALYTCTFLCEQPHETRTPPCSRAPGSAGRDADLPQRDAAHAGEAGGALLVVRKGASQVGR